MSGHECYYAQINIWWWPTLCWKTCPRLTMTDIMNKYIIPTSGHDRHYVRIHYANIWTYISLEDKIPSLVTICGNIFCLCLFMTDIMFEQIISMPVMTDIMFENIMPILVMTDITIHYVSVRYDWHVGKDCAHVHVHDWYYVWIYSAHVWSMI